MPSGGRVYSLCEPKLCFCVFILTPFYFLVFTATTNIIFAYPHRYAYHRLGTTVLQYFLNGRLF
jgi:hypothetical protein